MQSRIALPIIGIVLVVLLVAACGDRVPATPVNTRPEHYGVFVKTDKELLETAEYRGYPSTDATLPMVANSQPTLVVWLQNLVLDYVVLLDKLGSGNQVAYTARPVGSDGVIEIQPKYSLPSGAYCLMKVDPLASPAEVPFYCFRVGDQTTNVAMTPTSQKAQATVSPRALNAGGKTFGSPEEVIRYFMAGISSNNVEQILASSDFVERGQGFDFIASTLRLRSMTAATQLPSGYPLYREVDIATYKYQFLRQASWFALSLLSTEEQFWRGETLILDTNDPQTADRLNRFVAAIDPSNLANVRIEKFGTPAVSRVPEYVDNAAELAKVMGAAEQVERVTLLSFQGKFYCLGFTVLRYGQNWKISTLVANSYPGCSDWGSAQEMTRVEFDAAIILQ